MKRRVKQLHYDVIYLSETCRIAADAEPLTMLLNGFECTVTHDKLRAQPRDDYEDVVDAISALQPALDAWSATTELIDKCPVAFELAGYHYDPVPPPEGQVIYGESIVALDTATVEEKFVVTRDRFPAPREDIQTEGPVAAQLRRRWRNVVQGRGITDRGRLPGGDFSQGEVRRGLRCCPGDEHDSQRVLRAQATLFNR